MADPISWQDAIAPPKAPAGKTRPVPPESISWADASGVDPSQSAPVSKFTMAIDSLKNFGDPLKPYEATSFDDSTPRKQEFVENQGGAATGIVRERRKPPGGPDPTLAERGAQVLGTAAQVSDMFTSIGKQMLGAAPYWGARVATRIGGASQAESAVAAQEAKDYFFPPELSTPWAKVAERLGPSALKGYHENPVAWIMGKVGKVIEGGAEELTKDAGNLRKEDVMAAADQLMGSAFWKQVKPGIQKSFQSRMEQLREKESPYRDPNTKAYGEAAEPDTSVPYDTAPTPPDPTARAAELDAQIKAAAKAKTEVSKHVKAAAKFTKMAEKLDEGDPLRATLEERASISTQEAARVAAEQKAAREAEAGPSAEERFGGSAYDVGPEARAARQESAAEIARISQTPGHLRSAEDLIQMRAAVMKGREAGFIDPQAAKRFLATFAGLGAVGYGATQIWKELDPEGYEEWRQKARKGLGLKNDGPQPFPKLDDGKLFSKFEDMGPAMGLGLLLGGAIKGKGGMWHPEAVERLSSHLEAKLLPDGGAEFARRPNGEPADPKAAAAGQLMLDKSRKMVRDWLNKHAGTEGDPLKDVELPSGEKWGALVDDAVHSQKARDYHEREEFRLDADRADMTSGLAPVDPAVMKAKPEEDIWRFREAYGDGVPLKQLSSYLSHVGDYLRQNVDPAKLQQYDLVRAVKETAANDARVAKEMEKAAAASMKDMPVYKDYGDGMKWVELKEPKELTAEQRAKIADSGDYTLVEGEYVALGADGKPIRNSYTNEHVIENTPTKAHLAGQLAQEGNCMGHCVGGYAADVASGDTRILSLRDSKGRSHVTVELQQSGVWDMDRKLTQQMANRLFNRYPEVKKAYAKHFEASGNHSMQFANDFWVWLKEERPEVWKELEGENRATPLDINQIKGKQNRAPDAKYLPYVQDLVKGGKWGDVGDLQNTGLIRYGKKGFETTEKVMMDAMEAGNWFFKSPYGRDYINRPWNKEDAAVWEKRANKPFGEGNQTISDIAGVLAEPQAYARDPGVIADAIEAVNTLKEKGHPHPYYDAYRPKGQGGSADPKLLASIAAAGGIAAYAAANPDQLQNLAALGLLAAPLKGGKASSLEMIKLADKTFGLISTRLENLGGPAMKLRARQYEEHTFADSEKALETVKPYLAVLKTAKAGDALDLAATNDFGQVRALLKDQPAALKAVGAVEGLLKQFEKVHTEMGRFKEGLTNYLPRVVTDVEGLKKALGSEQRTGLEHALDHGDATMMKTRQRPMTEVERSIVINNYLKANPKPGLPGFAKRRGVDEVTPELREFYGDPGDSLLKYISAAVQDIQTAKFFGRDLAHMKVEGKNAIDIDASIGNLISRGLKDGSIKASDIGEIRDILEARFKQGEKQMAGGLQDIRNASNVALLGQFGSAATQIGDSVMTVYHHGLLPTLGALKQKLSGDSHVSTKEFGLVNHIAEELGSSRLTGRALQLVFRANGFSLIDQFAKGLNLNAGLLKNQALARTEKGRATLASRYAEAFGDEFPQLVEDLQSKTISPNVKSLLFSELSDAQPISKMEMPEAYLRNPNMRLMYQMKTYMLKQMDVIRRDAFQEMAAGNYVRGAKNLVAVASALALSNIPGDVIKDWLSGRDAKLDQNTLTDALLKNFGISQYSLDQMGKKPVETILNTMAPPYKHYQEMINAATSDRPQDLNKTAKYIPLVGRPLYDRELGGNEARMAVEAAKLRRQLRDEREDANPQLKVERLRKQEIKRQKALNKLRRQQ